MTDIVPEDAAANLISDGGTAGWDLPEPWIFDGTRRLYIEGEPSGWIARAVKPPEPGMADVNTGEETFVSLVAQAEGDTPMNATIALVEKLAAG